MKKHYFPGLDAIRLFAALSVVIYHLPGAMEIDHGFTVSQPVTMFFRAFTMAGYDAVSLFFVLSGFLITYLLLNETRTGRVDVMRFIMRRSLRIYPLYYLIVFMALVLAPHPAWTGKPEAILSMLLFLPSAPYVGVLGHLWSIRVEEWFYLAWGWVIKYLSVPLVVLIIIALRLLWAITLTDDPATFLVGGDRWGQGWYNSMRVEAMGLGAFGAWLLFMQHWTLRVIYRLQVLWLVVFALVILISFEVGIVFDLVIYFCYMGVILNVATNPHSILKLDWSALRTAGQATYGVYIYHPFILLAVGSVWRWSGMWADVALHIAVCAATVAVALLSYRYLEKPILRLKPYPLPEPRRSDTVPSDSRLPSALL